MQCPLTHAMGGRARANSLTTSECTSFGNQAHASCVGTAWIGTWCTIIINPRRMREGYGSMCVSVCICLLPR